MSKENRSLAFYHSLVERRRYTAALAEENTRLRAEKQTLIAENTALRQRLLSRGHQLVDRLTGHQPPAVHHSGSTSSVSTTPQPPAAAPVPPAPSPRHITPGKVCLISLNFYGWNGKSIYKGGAERYLFDLATLIKQKGFHPYIYQGADADFKKRYRGIEVVGLHLPSRDFSEASQIFLDACQDAELVIASPLDLAYAFTNIPTIGINHGVTSDWLINRIDYTNFEDLARSLVPLENLSQCVCVDTNYINLIRTYDHDLSQKLTYIPNYYDPAQFQPRRLVSRQKVTCVYPRRICTQRGYDLTIEAFRTLLPKYPQLELRFVGQANGDTEREEVQALIHDFPKQVSHAEYPMEKMSQAYQAADIVLIPTRNSEGTSLSCIEGLASQSAVIATNVGGLPNLIFDHFNGLLIPPTATALASAVTELLENPELRTRLARNGLAVAEQSFQKSLWEQRWSAVLDHYLAPMH